MARWVDRKKIQRQPQDQEYIKSRYATPMSKVSANELERRRGKDLRYETRAEKDFEIRQKKMGMYESREQRQIEKYERQKQLETVKEERQKIRQEMLEETHPERRKQLEQQLRLNKLREKDLHSRTRFQGLDFRGFAIGMGSPGEQVRRGLGERMKKLEKAYYNLDKKEHKFDLDRGIGGISHQSFNLKIPKLKTQSLGMKNLNLSFGDTRFDNKTKRRRKYNKKKRTKYKKYRKNKYYKNSRRYKEYGKKWKTYS